MKIEIKNRYTNEVIFTYEQENNSIKTTVELAVKLKINLSGANLSGANLSGADLSSAKLSSANLSGANLSGASLSGASLSNCIGNMKEIRSMQIHKWNISFTKDQLAIGCKQSDIEKWRNMADEEIDDLDEDALSWWKKWKEFIFMAIDLSGILED